jgi:hypothetical protein
MQPVQSSAGIRRRAPSGHRGHRKIYHRRSDARHVPPFQKSCTLPVPGVPWKDHRPYQQMPLPPARAYGRRSAPGWPSREPHFLPARSRKPGRTEHRRTEVEATFCWARTVFGRPQKARTARKQKLLTRRNTGKMDLASSEFILPPSSRESDET